VGWLHNILPFVAKDAAIEIHTYALCILAGIIVAIFITNYRLTKRGAEPWIIIDLTIRGIVTGIIGARAWHVLTHPDDYFGAGKDLFQIVNIPAGGLAIFGTLLGGGIGYFIGCRIAGLRFLSVADAIIPGLLIAQALGRFGNYFNQELFGLPTNLPWGLEVTRPNPAIPTGLPDNTLFSPTFAYESLWNLFGALLIVVIENRISVITNAPGSGKILPFSLQFNRRPQWQWGKVFGLYLIWYGLGRSWFESIRLDPLDTLFGIRLNVWGALIAIVLGIVIIAVQSRRHPGIEPSVYRPGKQWIPASEVDSDDTYSDTDDSDAAEGDDAAAREGASTKKKTKVAATSGSSGKP